MDEVVQTESEETLQRLLNFVVAHEIFSKIKNLVCKRHQLYKEYLQIFNKLTLEDVYLQWITYIDSTTIPESISVTFSVIIRSDGWWDEYCANQKRQGCIFRIILKMVYLEKVMTCCNNEH